MWYSAVPFVLSVKRRIKMPKTKQCFFESLWLWDEKYVNFHSWLEANPKDRTVFKCTICVKERKLSNMGVEALRSHMQSEGHVRRAKAIEDAKSRPTSIRNFFASKPSPAAATVTAASTSLATGSDDAAVEVTTESDISKTLSNTMKGFTFNDDDRVRAEVMWAMHFVDSNQSFRSCEKISELFKSMFRDSETAAHFSCGEFKARYLVTHGLKPFFLQSLREKIKGDSFVLLFDESLNKKLQRKQMDIYLR